MDLRKLKTLIDLVESSGIAELEMRRARKGPHHALGARAGAAARAPATYA